MDSVRRLAATVLLLARQRLELAALDFEEEVLRAGIALLAVLAVAALGALCLAALAAFVVVWWWDTARLQALLGVAAVFGGAAACIAWRLKRALDAKPPFLHGTLQELRKDGEQLAPRAAP
ncbi:phage holin family protein [Ramlibacter albus]|uniref:Phage holin family protein n=1 Tax=Ramlibacter albus TaxID=2079448 RepID=A0A923S156_9BURK|nr:phage holin family protein [Ramlibacter albus]